MLGARDLWQLALLALGWLGVNLRAPFWACCVCSVGVGIGLALVSSKAVNGTLPINCFVLLLQHDCSGETAGFLGECLIC